MFLSMTHNTNNGYATREGFSSLVEQFERPLSFFISRTTGARPEEVEDILQETFITAWKYINSFNPKYSIKAWLYRIARQQSIRSFRRRKARGDDLQLDADITTFEELASALDIAQGVDANLLSADIQKCLGMISEEYRTVLILRYVDDMSYDEISDVLKKSVGNVSILIHRAKSQLADTVQRHYPHLATYEKTL